MGVYDAIEEKLWVEWPLVSFDEFILLPDEIIRSLRRFSMSACVERIRYETSETNAGVTAYLEIVADKAYNPRSRFRRVRDVFEMAPPHGSGYIVYVIYRYKKKDVSNERIGKPTIHQN